MQIGDWVEADLYNGVIVQISNSYLFKEPVFNYSGDFPFLWDELEVPIKTDSDYQFGLEKFTQILQEIQGDYAQKAQIKWDKMTEKLMVEHARVQPMVTLRFDQNWITYTLRYVVDYKFRRDAKHKLTMEILKAINESGGRLIVGASTLEITGFPSGNK